MSQPMFKIRSGEEETPKAIANLLPCRIHHDGPIDTTEPFWNPTKSEDGKNIGFFRGRKLHGKSVKLPEGYRGVMVEKVEEKADAPKHAVTEIDEDEVREVLPEPRAMQVKGEFDEVMVWGHEVIADATSDPHVRGLEEWLQVSAQIHSYTPPDQSTAK